MGAWQEKTRRTRRGLSAYAGWRSRDAFIVDAGRWCAAQGKPSLEPPRPEDVALFLHTSGTTSRPKVLCPFLRLESSVLCKCEPGHQLPRRVSYCLVQSRLWLHIPPSMSNPLDKHRSARLQSP